MIFPDTIPRYNFPIQIQIRIQEGQNDLETKREKNV
jgi:hypothetical protein